MTLTTSFRWLSGLLLALLLFACAPSTPAPTTAPTALPVAATAAPSPVPPTTAPAATSVPQTVKLAILHSNDLHGYLEPELVKLPGGGNVEVGGMANLAGFIDAFRAEYGGNVLVLDAGDIWRGTFLSNQNKGELAISTLNMAGYDAAAPGNHDFDDGQDVLQARITQSKFPWLAANLIETATGKPPFGMKPYIVKEIAGVRLGVIGLANPGTPIINKPASVKGLQFLSGPDGVKRVLDEVKRQSDIVVVLSHLGVDDDIQMANAVPGIDIIIGGHSHTTLNNARVESKTIVAQTGSNGKNVGKLELIFDRATKKLIEAGTRNELQPVTNAKVAPNAAIAALVKQKLEETRAIVSRPIGETQVDLTLGRLPDGRTSGEYPAGNLVVDAMLAANQAGDRPAELAMHNNAGLRADLLKGPITYGQLYQMLPFDNALTAMDLTGEQIKSILEVAASCPRVNTLIAGMKFTYDCTLPSGSRIMSITIQGQPYDKARVYRVQTIDYLAGGGDGQVAFRDGKNLVYGDLVVDVVAAYVKAKSPLNIQVEGRMVASH
ncbi:MAG: bifunctional metallophosphatase/5'-nucleotidase [Chloroflexi bacterium]|nr:bifunctional metallophosphatase/5'-nucleotidase [Chloroflexota bacterium]